MMPPFDRTASELGSDDSSSEGKSGSRASRSWAQRRERDGLVNTRRADWADYERRRVAGELAGRQGGRKGKEGREGAYLILIDIPRVPLGVPSAMGVVLLDDVADVDDLELGRERREGLDEHLGERRLARAWRAGDEDIRDRRHGLFEKREKA
jgi:hypothetical protein